MPPPPNLPANHEGYYQPNGHYMLRMMDGSYEDAGFVPEHQRHLKFAELLDSWHKYVDYTVREVESAYNRYASLRGDQLTHAERLALQRVEPNNGPRRLGLPDYTDDRHRWVAPHPPAAAAAGPASAAAPAAAPAATPPQPGRFVLPGVPQPRQAVPWERPAPAPPIGFAAGPPPGGAMAPRVPPVSQVPPQHARGGERDWANPDGLVEWYLQPDGDYGLFPPPGRFYN